MGHKRSVMIYDETTTKVFNSVKEAAIHLGVTGSAVTHALQKRKTVKRFKVDLVPDQTIVGEIWLQHEQGFEVSNFGRFRKGNEIYLGNISNVDGYRRCRLNGKTYLMHIPVMQCFDIVNLLLLEMMNEDVQVDHINGVKHDNRIENLRWCTRSQNMKYAKNKLTNLS